MGLYTGARLGEIAQLRLEDVVQVGDVWLLNVTKDDDDSAEDARTVKTAAAIRSIPIHSALIKLGFLDYVETVRHTGAFKLFPSLKKALTAGAVYRPSGSGATERKKMSLITARPSTASAIA
ncbi:hypothetical protein MBH78_13535 [Oceanimonas sp. NS1]|nr:hypothetical protein [Oceanimonas sp. NS1]